MRAATDRMFRAFADETRLRVLSLLSRGGELCVCDLQAILRLSQPKTSRHLAYLRRAGLVKVRREGLWRHYSLAAPRDAFHRGLVACLGGCFAEAGVLRRDAAALSRARRRACR
ncbi:MAG: metalloregulator ArsR/SmtB family transcription factor [Elusimicrobia bacterium]|nr:metalloregulator ArsR/SmtB family transcription factor [Elusimicrobiota bacterium]